MEVVFLSSALPSFPPIFLQGVEGNIGKAGNKESCGW